MTKDSDLKRMLYKELRQYEATASHMTLEERNELREWVKGGNSPYDNPYYMADERGYPFHYLTAIRISKELSDLHDNLKKGPDRIRTGRKKL